MTWCKPRMRSADCWSDFPSRIPAGKLFQFRFSIPEQTSLELMSEIAGLTLTPQGELRWTPTSEQVGVHELKIRVEQGGDICVPAPTTGGD